MVLPIHLDILKKIIFLIYYTLHTLCVDFLDSKVCTDSRSKISFTQFPQKNIKDGGCVYSDSVQQHFQKEMEKMGFFLIICI